MNGRRNLWTAKLLGKSAKAENLVVKGTRFSGLIFGIDPSLRGTGFSIIEVGEKQTLRLVTSLTLKISSTKTFVECLGEIFSTTERFLKDYPVKAVGVEETIYVQNSKTAQILGSARGACLSAVALHKIPVKEFPPLRIKKSVTGIGQATKEQVAKMVKQLLNLSVALPSDESDATAAALCYFFSLKSLLG